MNKPMIPFSERVTAFLLEVAEESLTSGISERLKNREEGGALDEGGGMEATMFRKRSSNESGSGGSMEGGREGLRIPQTSNPRKRAETVPFE